MGQRGAVLAGLPALLVLAVGVGLLAAPWWSATLPPADRPIAVVLGAIFTAVGTFVLVPEDWERLRTLAFVGFIGTFGLVCGALAASPFRPKPDGTLTIGGIPGFVASAPIPWWARIVAGFFAIVCLGSALLGGWGLVRGLFGRER